MAPSPAKSPKKEVPSADPSPSAAVASDAPAASSSSDATAPPPPPSIKRGRGRPPKIPGAPTATYQKKTAVVAASAAADAAPPEGAPPAPSLPGARSKWYTPRGKQAPPVPSATPSTPLVPSSSATAATPSSCTPSSQPRALSPAHYPPPITGPPSSGTNLEALAGLLERQQRAEKAARAAARARAIQEEKRAKMEAARQAMIRPATGKYRGRMFHPSDRHEPIRLREAPAAAPPPPPAAAAAGTSRPDAAAAAAQDSSAVTSSVKLEAEDPAVTAKTPPPSAAAAAAAASSTAETEDKPTVAELLAAASARMKAKKEEADKEAAEIKLREGWRYKLGHSKWRAVYDPNRKSLPPPPRAMKNEEEKEKEAEGEGGAGRAPPLYIVVHSPQPPPPPAKKSEEEQPKQRKPRAPFFRKRKQYAPGSPGESSRATAIQMSHIKENDRSIATAIKKAYDERMAEEAASSSSAAPPILGALIKYAQEERGAPDEHCYTKNLHTAEVVTTFPLEEVETFSKKRFKAGHVVINTPDLEEIFKKVHTTCKHLRRWKQIKARAEEDEEYRAKRLAKKKRETERSMARRAAMTPEERAEHNKKDREGRRTRKLIRMKIFEPNKVADLEKEQEKEVATKQEKLERDKALLETVEDPEERRRIRRRIIAAERTPEVRRQWNRRDYDYSKRLREKEKNMTPEERAELEEKKRLRKERAAELALLTPQERQKIKQKEYHERYQAKKRALREAAAARGEPLPDPPKKTRKRKAKEGGGDTIEEMRRKKKRREEKEREDEPEYDGAFNDMMDNEEEGGELDVDEISFEENLVAAQAISSSSPRRRHPTAYHPYEEEEEDDDVMQITDHHIDIRDHRGVPIGGSSSSRPLALLPPLPSPPKSKMAAELEQLRKDVAWSEKAIHNSRVEVERLRTEAEGLETAIEQELDAQETRRRRINILTRIMQRGGN